MKLIIQKKIKKNINNEIDKKKKINNRIILKLKPKFQKIIRSQKKKVEKLENENYIYKTKY